MTDPKALKQEDEEEDDDYRPEEDEDVDMDDDEVVTTVHEEICRLSSKQEQQLDASFEQLFGYKWGTVFSIQKEELSPNERLLCNILGPSAAAHIIVSSSSRSSSTTTTIKAHKRRHTPAKPKNAAAVAVALVKKEQKSVEKMVVEENNSTAPGAPASSAGGMDSLLKTLEGPEKTTTVAKTSADWDQFKEKSGLGDKIEEKAESKDAYLNRQGFLNRVDQRKFELERNGRNQERSKRGV
jgi:hypothetical protein